MGKSLADQLLGAGLVDKNKVKKAQTEQRKAKKQQRKHKIEQVDEARVAAEQERKAKVERDRKLNEQRLAEQRQKEILAQIRQMIQQSAIERSGGETDYNFTHQSKVKKLSVTSEQQTALANGALGIAYFEDAFHLVPRNVAEKIAERNSDYVALLNDRPVKKKVEQDDPYAGYEIPDDLMW